ncbi:MAG TPA: hypothetical protein VFL17_01105 [Anaerolineae bacterium]|nr:hypothetical protein [Anaerolineae bacterium]
MKDETLIREFTRIFRCTPEMAPTYLKRVHERMGYEVPLESIVAALHQISPKRLTMDALIERLRKMERTPRRARKPAPSQGSGQALSLEGSPVAERGDPERSRRTVGAPAGVDPQPALRSPRPRAKRGGAGSRSPGPERSEGEGTAKGSESSKPSAMTQISIVLTRNWERGRRQGLKPSVMTTDRFVKTAQSIAGVPTPSVARVLKSVEKLDRLDILLTPNLVADDINGSDEPLRSPPSAQ